MKTEEKTSMDAVAQVIFRPSAECRGYYRFHYGYLLPAGSFDEESELSFWEFLGSLAVPSTLQPLWEILVTLKRNSVALGIFRRSILMSLCVVFLTPVLRSNCIRECWC